MFGSRFPTQKQLNENLPTNLVKDGRVVRLAGLEIIPYVIGQSKSADSVIYWLPSLNSAIVGDLVNAMTISAPTLSLQNWLEQLERMK